MSVNLLAASLCVRLVQKVYVRIGAPYVPLMTRCLGALYEIWWYHWERYKASKSTLVFFVSG